MTPIESALKSADFKVFARVLRASKYDHVLESGGPYTIFAPTNEAFAKFPPGALDGLLNGDPELLHAVAGYHFAAGKVLSSRFAGKRIRAVTYGGGHLIIDGKNGLRVGAANLVRPDILAGPSVIHGIDGVLWPREPAAVAR